MKNMLVCISILLVATITLTTACKKDKKTQTAYQKNLQLIVDKNWKITFNGFDANNDGILDYDFHFGNENSMADCMIDDHYIFKADSTMYIKALGETNGCGSDGGPFNWCLTKDGKKVFYANDTSEIIVLNDTMFRFKVTVDGEQLYTEFRR